MARQHLSDSPTARRGIRWTIVLFLVVAGSGFFYLRGLWSAEAPIPNLLLVTFDTTRADHIGCYGGSRASTPTLDLMAREGVLFENCIAVAPITLPSHASILTGIYPYRHGVRNNATHHLPERIPTLAGALLSAGLETGAVVSAVVLDSRYGLDRGFVVYDDDLSAAVRSSDLALRETKAEDTTRRALRWLAERGDERWFLWVHYFDPHAGYEPPEAYTAKCQGSRYDGEIAYADAQMGEILEALRSSGDLDDTLVVMTSDHGESLGEHGEATHSLFIYDATTRVPLILSHPSLVRGRRVPEVVSSVDIVPTVLELLDVAPQGKLDGRSLARRALGAGFELEGEPAYSESMTPLQNHGWSDLRALRGDGTRYIRAPRPEFYDLVRDPQEIDNLYPGPEGQALSFESQLEHLLPAKEADEHGESIEEMDPEMRESMAALGYLWSAEEGDAEPSAERPDPKDKIHLWSKYLLGRKLAAEDRLEESETVLRSILDEDSDSADARLTLVKVLCDLERKAEAMELLRETVSSYMVRGRVFVRLATLERELDPASWPKSLLKAKALDPRDPKPWVQEGDWALEDDEVELAVEAYLEALQLDDRTASAWVGLSRAKHRQGLTEEAEEAIQHAVAAEPNQGSAHVYRGAMAESAKRPEEAMRCYQEALRLEPDLVLAHVKIADLHSTAGRNAEAEASYRDALRIDPRYFSAHYNLGVHYLRTGNRLEATGTFRQAAQAETARPQAWRKLMTAARASDDFTCLLAAARRLLELRPDDFQGVMASAVANLKLGQRTAAAASLRRAFELDPKRAKARAAKDAGLGSLAEELGLGN